MSVDRLERVNALLRRAIGEALYKVFAGDPINLATVTITRVETARNLRNATVSVSIFGEERERSEVLRKLIAKTAEIQTIINREMTLKYTPRLRFVHDGSIEKGDHVLAILEKLEVPTDEADSVEDEA